MKALIIGAGVGGLTAATALRGAGIDALVLEQAHDLRELGTGLGIGVWRNAMLGLQSLGLAEEVAAIGIPVEREEFWSSRGEVLADWSIGDLERKLGKLPAPSIGALRADLYPVLAAALDRGAFRLDASCVGVEQDGSGVTARLADGREERGDILIGADGAQSTIRGLVSGDVDARYAGYAAWQGVVTFEHEDVPVGGLRHVWGWGRRFSFFPVAPGRLYWFTYANDLAGNTPPDGGWKAWLRERFRGWPRPTEEIVAATDAEVIRRIEVMDRALPPRWGVGRVTLLGDAAHPMQPNLGQGACQAIEDAVVLGQCLTNSHDPVAALRQYEAQRRRRTVRYYRLARRIGKLGKWENALACSLRDRVLKLSLQRIVLNRQVEDLAFGSTTDSKSGRGFAATI